MKIIFEYEYKFQLFHSIALLIIMLFVFDSWVLKNFEGFYWKTLLPGSNFGVPDYEQKEFGMHPITPSGWDGQFYYYISNDLLGKTDTPFKMDVPQYRYQRVGVALIAKVASVIFLNRNVTAEFYLKTQFFLTAIGFFTLLVWLKQNKLSFVWAYTWLGNVGIVICLRHGLPDPVSDSLLIICLYCVVRNHFYPYIFFSSLLPLVREVYFLIPLFIGIFSFSKIITWEKSDHRFRLDSSISHAWVLLLQSLFSGKINRFKNFITMAITNYRTILSNKIDFKNLIILLIPILIFLAWQIYVKTKIHHQGSVGISFAFPFQAGVESVLTHMKISELSVLMLQAYLLILFLSITLSFKNFFRHPIFPILFAYSLLVSTLGFMVWSDHGAFSKTVSPFVAILVFMLPYEKSSAIRFILLINVFLSLLKLYQEFLN